MGIETKPERRSLLVAVWPGMGQVAITAGFYLLSKFQMQEEEAPETRDLFDLDHIDIENGIARAGRIPLLHLFVRQGRGRGEPERGVVIGEAQPPLHHLDYCDRILDRAHRLGVGQVFTFAASVRDMKVDERPRVFGAATDAEGLEELRRGRVEILDTGRITGLNGVFLAAAARRGIPGICLLGETPSFATQIPWPKASHAVLEAFSRLTGIEVDLRELEEYGRAMERQVSDALSRVSEALDARESPDQPAATEERDAAEASEVAPSVSDRRKIESLFAEASRDRSKAFELKRELDRLGLFRDYEDRFLDIFRKAS